MKHLLPSYLHFDELYDQIRYKIVWNLTLVVSMVLILVAFFNVAIRMQEPLTPYVAGILIGGISLFYMRKKKDYKLISKLLSIGSFIIICSSVFFINDRLHYSTPMWMIMSILFTFFTINNKWGLSLLILYSLVMTYYINNDMAHVLKSLQPMETTDAIKISVVYLVCFGGIGYILYHFLITNKYAQNELQTINSKLQEQHELIINQHHEREVMLKEIHHRVKNNLQVITSLLRLQSYNDAENKDAFRESINRVCAMALIHEQMYRDENLINLDLQEYIESLFSNLVENYSVRKKISLDVKADFDSIEHKTIIPLALILNELITNSIKHSFTNLEYGEIKVHIYKASGDYFKLNYSDSGEKQNYSESSFGVELIQSMTDQLDGDFNLSNRGVGNEYSFRLKNIIENTQFN